MLTALAVEHIAFCLVYLTSLSVAQNTAGQLVNNELKRMWKEAILAIQLPCPNFPGVTEEKLNMLY